MSKKDIIICRCEDVSLQDLHDVLQEGYETFEDVKRILRVGMGPCQGNSCSLLVQREIASFFKQPLETVKIHTSRPLTTGVKLGAIVKASSDES